MLLHFLGLLSGHWVSWSVSGGKAVRVVIAGYQILVVFASEAIKLCAAAVADFCTSSTVAIVFVKKGYW